MSTSVESQEVDVKIMEVQEEASHGAEPSPRSSQLKPAVLNFLTSVYQKHFSSYCQKRSNRPKQKIPGTVWKSMMPDIREAVEKGELPDVDLASLNDLKRQRQMKECLVKMLKDLDTGTSDEKGQNPELQSEELMVSLKKTDTYQSRVVQERRESIMAGMAKKRPRHESAGYDSAREEKTAKMAKAPTKQDIRLRTTEAIENISKTLSHNSLGQHEFLRQQTERHEWLKTAKGGKQKLLIQQSLKGELELLKMQMDMGLISQEDFQTKAKSLFSNHNNE